MRNTVIIFIIALASMVSSMALAISENNPVNKTKTIAQNCFAVTQAENELNKWASTALRSETSIGCPSTSPISPLSRLETALEQGGICGNEAASQLLAFYTIFANNPNYAMCGLQEKEDVLMANITLDRKICADQPINKVVNCFSNVSKTISNLKTRGEVAAAFKLASKTANSNDVTGLSQMFLGVMYYFGEGTNKNLPLAIKWLKDALEKVEDNSMRIIILTTLGVAYEDVHDYQNAKHCYQQCAVLGDTSCDKGFIRLNQ